MFRTKREVSIEGGDSIGAEQLAQGYTEHLATLVENSLHDATEELLVAAKTIDIVASHADDSRLHLWWRIENRRFNREELFDIVPSLDEDGKDAVGLRTRLSSDAQGHLPLNHTCAAGDEVAVVKHLEKNL